MPKSTKIITIVALLLVLALATLDSTIVATAMPGIVSQLGGITLYSWAFSAYLLTSTTVVPLYGKLADIYGRKLLLLVGAVIFLVGSAACGSAQSMEQLIFFRGLQGLGAGAIQPLVLTVMSDISSSAEENARMLGAIGALWGVASVVGPLLGGLIVDHFPWQWIFYLNLPFGLLAIVLLAIFFQERFVRQKHQLDYLGAILLTGAVIALLLFLLQGGTAWAWVSLPSLALLLATLILSVAFFLVERRAAEPILPLELFTERTIALSNSGSFLLGCILFSLTTYVPLFVQGVQGSSGTEAGTVLIPNLVSWAIISMLASLILRYFGYRFIVLTGALFIAVGTGMMVFFREQTGFAFLALAMIVCGIGFGLARVIYTLAVQRAARKELVGVATASSQFVSMIGGTLGVAVMGAILNGQIQQRLMPIIARVAASGQRLPEGTSAMTVLLTPALRATLPLALLEQLRAAFSQSLFWVFLTMLLMALLGLLIMLWFPAVILEQPDSSVSGELETAHSGANED
ncbi:MFS transporter [Ktedonosporobacter rubrisoli]|uniref:MFS transporter n=1 Tax=Ktedonosporobacter rubrisoli TaxID=2509675 RepID=A0A4P6JIP6_KTERU|nr:MDR family MFS transporter [Ktedonosporobacter rubrisoli]QBD74938.1 MFS transporter [Ktedonosporobacter rubrisoli]